GRVVADPVHGRAEPLKFPSAPCIQDAMPDGGTIKGRDVQRVVTRHAAGCAASSARHAEGNPAVLLGVTLIVDCGRLIPPEAISVFGNPTFVAMKSPFAPPSSHPETVTAWTSEKPCATLWIVTRKSMPGLTSAVAETVFDTPGSNRFMEPTRTTR